MICFPNAKINLGLHVINKRSDGFHNIESVFYPVPLCDILEIVECKDHVTEKCRLITEGIPVDGNLEDNLIIKAFNLLDSRFNLPPVDICLYKKIPMGAGLGGGSSDAAFMLVLLNNKFELGLTRQELKEYASKLGSDCAFFIDNAPAYLFGKGHEMVPYSISLKGWYLVLIYPNQHSNTALAYSKVKRREQLDKENNLLKNLQLPVELWKERVFNDFEESVSESIPQIREIKKTLYQAGASFALMSGSGSAVFGLFKTKPNLPEELSFICVYEGEALY